MRKVIIGTAGHVDHGKTTLIEALTGIDCDRWTEEKQRGITLDLGFAHLADDEVQLSFVDVPGHEHFLHNALAGFGGLGAVLLVIDAGEGVRAQTIEHLTIVRLLGIERVVVALTKIDAVDADWLELVTADVRNLLQQQGLDAAAIHPVSARSGQGLEAIKEALVDVARTTTPFGDRPTRLPVDRAFQVTGRGTIVTGSPASGTLRSGMELSVDGGSRTVRVRRLEVHGVERETAGVGERVAAQLAGVSPDEVGRGIQLVSDGDWQRSRACAGHLSLLPNARRLESTRDFRLHLYSSAVQARVRPLTGAIEPGASGLVEVLLARQTVLACGDRAILRRSSPATTVGSLEVIDPVWRRPRGRRLARALKLLDRDADGVVLWWAQAARLAGLTASEVKRRTGEAPGHGNDLLQNLAAEGSLVQLPNSEVWVSGEVFRDLARAAAEELDQFHRSNPLEPGMPKAVFVRRHLAAARDPQPCLDLLASIGVLREESGSVRAPGQGETLDDAQSRLADRLARALQESQFQVPSPPVLARDLGAKTQMIEGLLHYLQRHGRAIRLPSGLWVSAVVMRDTIDDLHSAGWDSFSVGDFKDRYGLSRKWAIPVLEYLDSQRITVRQGDRRVLL